MATAHDLKVRLGAVKLVLTEKSGKATYENISKVQSLALTNVIKKAELSDESKAELSTLACSLNWHTAEHCVPILEAFAEQPPEGLPKRRRGLQDYSHFLAYGHEEFWRNAQAENIPAANKLQSVCQYSNSA